jgi:hypothetical protein
MSTTETDATVLKSQAPVTGVGRTRSTHGSSHRTRRPICLTAVSQDRPASREPPSSPLAGIVGSPPPAGAKIAETWSLRQVARSCRRAGGADGAGRADESSVGHLDTDAGRPVLPLSGALSWLSLNIPMPPRLAVRHDDHERAALHFAGALQGVGRSGFQYLVVGRDAAGEVTFSKSRRGSRLGEVTPGLRLC